MIRSYTVASTEKRLPCPSQLQQILIAGLVLHAVDPRRRRPAPAGGDHLSTTSSVRENRLDAAVAAVAHPAFEIVRGLA